MHRPLIPEPGGTGAPTRSGQSPGNGTDFAEASTNPQVRSQITEMRDRIAIPPEAIAQAIAFVIEQPATVAVNEIVVRPTAQN
ncbi:hypothetical protein M878_01975 [Streptomyces roseochromogenus subsp. oscitans DS 12.976]|uniref:Oxidoreductase n=1 Tax=Streptomyces roseochromogenus subsp. oscitans DS 12.976 TaxID=1352936 RepID=V6KWG7_STRRC|nr:hypothetical protein [Streptomyces roseochromogenus]EST36477.1 hypothetical protein M878_01975 [Streptomyces roseochromogenus subsp. oscitans DS 12.976]